MQYNIKNEHQDCLFLTQAFGIICLYRLQGGIKRTKIAIYIEVPSTRIMNTLYSKNYATKVIKIITLKIAYLNSLKITIEIFH